MVAEALNALKMWWQTPHTVTGEGARLDAAVVALKRLGVSVVEEDVRV